MFFYARWTRRACCEPLCVFCDFLRVKALVLQPASRRVAVGCLVWFWQCFGRASRFVTRAARSNLKISGSNAQSRVFCHVRIDPTDSPITPRVHSSVAERLIAVLVRNIQLVTDSISLYLIHIQDTGWALFFLHLEVHTPETPAWAEFAARSSLRAACHVRAASVLSALPLTALAGSGRRFRDPSTSADQKTASCTAPAGHREHFGQRGLLTANQRVVPSD